MKRELHFIVTALLMIVGSQFLQAQTALVEDQNPAYTISRDKYMKMSDSINTWHSTTQQDTYKAIDFLVDKREARDQRRNFRREIRLERARNGYGWNTFDYGYYSPGYSNNLFSPYSYNGYNNYGYRSYGRHNNWNNYFWNTLPFAVTLGLLSR